MGLDMYLMGVKDIDEYDVKTKKLKIKTLLTDEIYWRKANHIHKWFVDNVQDGCDNCAYYPVSNSDLKKLRDACNLVLSNPKEAEEILPTQSGFFFGSTEYDEYYFYDCERTVLEIDRILNETDYDMMMYSSSW